MRGIYHVQTPARINALRPGQAGPRLIRPILVLISENIWGREVPSIRRWSFMFKAIVPCLGMHARHNFYNIIVILSIRTLLCSNPICKYPQE